MERMTNQGPNGIEPDGLQKLCEALRAELVVRETVEQELRAKLAASQRRGWRSGRWVGQVPAFLTALTAVGALIYTGQGLAQSQAATTEQNRLALSGQITDRFNAAVTNLGSNTMTIRLGGIYALQRIMNDSSADQPAVDQVLSAFIRSQPPVTPVTSTNQHTAQFPIDSQAALDVLLTRNHKYDKQPIDLIGANLGNASLRGADVTNVHLSGADLSHADLQGANLTGVVMVYANLTGANLADAHFNGTFLQGSNLTDAYLPGVTLTGAHLTQTTYCAGTRPVQPRYGYVCVP